ncbi:hypothetical protein [Streptomyces purpurogeneiscleroticus]|uniref:hypothetical protein n=1 Tax=Streptomyces purpurogeneiscleroticus TaxID=68259 RepID=UPI001CBB21C6|nr:hypothetical protein [Streptomyces purpurogeneiscleroticus]MBZ4018608.1 hypothetical protein [Streptomyces purpurogeneiscleroticus]
MVMQDGGLLDVRPGADPGRAAPEHSGAYLATGLALGLYAGALVAWVVTGVAEVRVGPLDFVEGLFNPLAGPVGALGPQEWALAVALAAVAGAALAQRTLARPAALLLACLVLARSLREGIGLLHPGYRSAYSFEAMGGWTLATHVLGLLTGLVVLSALLPARTEPGPAAGAWWRGRLSRICAVLFLLAGLVQAAWTVRLLTDGTEGAGAWLAGAVDAAVLPSADAPDAGPGFAALAAITGWLVIGALALSGRRDMRGALLVFAAVQLYLTVRTVVGYAVTDAFSAGTHSVEGTLDLATTAYLLAAMTSVLVLTTGRAFSPSQGTTHSWARTRPE